MGPARFRLQEVLGSKGMSQSELSRKSGVSLVTVSRICRNVTKQVSLATLDRIAAALGVSMGDLLEQKTEKRRGK
jgi:putative transcriptional regulator